MPNPIRFFDDVGEIDADAYIDASKIVMRPKCVAFRVKRFEIEDGQNWLVEDVLVHGRSQLRQPGRIPGDVLSLPPATVDAFMRLPLDVIQTAMEFTMIAVYVGTESPAPAFACKVHGDAARVPA